MKSEQLRELLAIGYGGQVPFEEFVRMVNKALAADVEIAWLIERDDDLGMTTVYWGGPDFWTSNHLQAIRFARRVDGENVVRRLGWMRGDLPLRVLEHMWPGRDA